MPDAPSESELEALPPDGEMPMPPAVEAPPAGDEAPVSETTAAERSDDSGADSDVQDDSTESTGGPGDVDLASLEDPPMEGAKPSTAEKMFKDEDDPLQTQGIQMGGDAIADSDAPTVILNGRFDIHPSRPLPDLDSPSARAFEADNRMHPQTKVFALVCIPELAVRAEIIEQIVEHQIPGCLGLMDYDVVHWPLLKQKTIVLILERPTGGRVSSVLLHETSEYKKINYLRASLDGMVEGLGQLHSRGINHRAVRHDNLFFLDDTREKVLLGEFVSSPPGFDQPVAYETIERSMADEGGRGNGLAEDDMYACGVALAFMIQKSIPTKGFSKEALILTKIKETSYQTLVGSNLITTTFLDALRGLLNDEPSERWSFEELEIWKTGRRVPPSHTQAQSKSHRILKLGGFDHVHARTLAYSMAKRPETALKMIKDGTIEQWVSRGLKDLNLASAIAGSVEWAEAQEDNPETDELLLTRVLMQLDPLAPIRFKGISYMPDAFGMAMIVERLRGGEVRALAESVLLGVPKLWFENNGGPAASADMVTMGYNRIRTYLRKKGPGYGIERCIYELNHGFPCQSPLLGDEYIMDVEDVLPALNEIEKSVDSKTIPVDRHIAAFVAAKVKYAAEPFLHEIADPDEALKTLGHLKLLAFLQDLYTPRPLLGLAKWIGGQMGPVIKLYQSRPTRKALEAEVPNMVRTGMLSELLNLLDDSEARMLDKEGYTQAVEKFRIAQDEIEEIKFDIGPNSDKADRTAKQAASITSIVIMTFVVILMLVTA